jgi:hypothetical protein
MTHVNVQRQTLDSTKGGEYLSLCRTESWIPLHKDYSPHHEFGLILMPFRSRKSRVRP